MMNITETGMTSININLSVKHREPVSHPPLNVYIRIRPFIADELERGENQKLINIHDEKHISVKLSPTINNTIRNLQTSYNEYEVTRIFDHDCTQQQLFEEILAQPTNEIFTGSNWLFCTLGLTNSGKTHTMFGTNDEGGLIPKCLQRIFVNVGQNLDNKLLFKPVGLENLIPIVDSDLNMEISVRNYIFKDEKSRNCLPTIVEQQQNNFKDFSVTDDYYSVWISFFELYNENILDLLVQPKDMKSRKNLRLVQNDHSTIIKNLIQIPVFNIKEAEDIIKFGFSNRSTSKTTLNQASSRSHAIICITLITINEFDEEPTLSHMYICDLAGNEPTTGTGKLLTETCNINTSLMTFKDCIRILNENQSAKKQMLVPYRNSILTSIFRPFFNGRGRTIICCNINPCATFITQTNDLLKFCALAQKTVIVQNEAKIGGGLIRPQRKSKNKGPKRLGKHRISKEKNVTNNNQTDETDFQSMNESSLTIPTDIKSISYWKYCTKRALDLLQKQALNRRKFFTERHQERVKTIQYFLQQRQLNEKLIHENQSIIEQNEILSKNLRLEQNDHLHTQQLYNQSILNENKYKEEIDLLREQFECLKSEHLKSVEQIKHDKNEYEEREQEFQDEIQRLKRDFGLELYRKQDAEKKARLFEEKYQQQQTQYQKIQYDFTKTKHDLKTLQVKYDALQLEMIDIHKTTKPKSIPIIDMVDERTSTTTVQSEKRTSRTKRPTNDEHPYAQIIKKPKRIPSNESTASTNTTSTFTQQSNESEKNKTNKPITRNESTASTNKNIIIPIKRTRRQLQNDVTDSAVKPKTSANHTRAKKQIIQTEASPPPPPVQQESHSPIYATIQRDSSIDRVSFATVAVNSSTVQIPASNEPVNTTPKSSTFKRIQSFFRATPTLTNSAKLNRVVQVKNTVVAFGSSTPTNRIPPSVVKTPGPTPAASVAQKISTPKSKYNLRTRLFNNQISKVDDEGKEKVQTKKPIRTRK